LIEFAGQVALVTGAGHGLGRAHALELARRGAAVVVNDIGRDRAGISTARGVAEEIVAAGGRAAANLRSVADPEGAEAMVAEAIAEFGRLDVLVNNAGVSHFAWFEDLTLEDFDALHAVHLRGAMVATRAAYRHMIGRGYGRIVFTVSGSGLFGRRHGGAYSTAKMGLVGLMNAVALEGESHGVLANAVAPTAATGIAGANPAVISDMMRNASLALSPWSDPAFVSPLVAYLASSACTVNRCLYSAVAGRYARVFISAGEGWLSPSAEPPSADEIAERFADIHRAEVRLTPGSIDEEIDDVARRRGGALAGE